MPSFLVAILSLGVARWLYNISYNLYLHPLAKFPDPRWAAASYLAEFYYDVVKGGQAVLPRGYSNARGVRRVTPNTSGMNPTFLKYVGPLARINPHALSFNDPFLHETVFAGSGQKREEDPIHVARSGLVSASITTVYHDLHRQRRDYISSFFSKRSITKLEALIQSKVDLLVERLKEAYQKNETLVGPLVFGALTTDIITHYAYGESFDELNKTDFPGEIEQGLRGMLLSYHWRRFFPVIDKPPSDMGFATP